MKYTLATVAKAITAFIFGVIGAAVTASHGGDIFSLGASAWFSAFSTGLVSALAVFTVPNKVEAPQSYDPVAPEDQIINGLNQLQQQKAAVDAAIEKAKGGLSSAVQDVPVLGPLAQQAIDALP
jgi:hypothetical protein